MKTLRPRISLFFLFHVWLMMQAAAKFSRTSEELDVLGAGILTNIVVQCSQGSYGVIYLKYTSK